MVLPAVRSRLGCGRRGGFWRGGGWGGVLLPGLKIETGGTHIRLIRGLKIETGGTHFR